MAKKESITQKAYLIVDKDKIREVITERINAGKELVSRSVPSHQEYAYPRIKTVYDDAALNKFEQDKSIWVNTTAEILKQVFDIPNNEYHRDFVQACSMLGIYTNDTDWLAKYKEDITSGLTQLEAFIQKLEWIPQSPNISSQSKKEAVDGKANKNVFIVHGRDEKVRLEVEDFVKVIGYKPIVLAKEANVGKTIIEKIESNSEDVCYAIVIYTACDEGRLKGQTDLNPRARQNVVFEHGFMCSKLGRSRVTALLEQGVEQPGDLAGVVYVQLDSDGAWKLRVVREMKAVGLEVDANKLI